MPIFNWTPLYFFSSVSFYHLVESIGFLWLARACAYRGRCVSVCFHAINIVNLGRIWLPAIHKKIGLTGHNEKGRIVTDINCCLICLSLSGAVRVAYLCFISILKQKCVPKQRSEGKTNLPKRKFIYNECQRFGKQ